MNIKNWVPIVLASACLASNAYSAPVTRVLNASPYKPTYNTIKAVLGPTATAEVPDEYFHLEAPVEHITTVYDQDLKKYVFEIASHWNDGDYITGNSLKARTEIKVDKDSLLVVKEQGEATVWNFFIKLNEGFVATDKWTHLFQAKAESRNGEDLDPRIRLSLYNKNGIPTLQLNNSDDSNGFNTLKSVDATQLIGQWIKVTLKVKWSDQGYLEFTLKKLSTGETLINCKKTNIDLWSNDWAYMRFKAGIYRAYSSLESYRESVTARFSNIKLVKKKTIQYSNTLLECDG